MHPSAPHLPRREGRPDCKFLHAADLHLDSPLRGLAAEQDSPIQALRGATRRAFENLVDLALQEEVDFVLLAGDLYDGSWQDLSTGIFLARQLGRLGEHAIRVFAVVGNHDAESRITKALEKPQNLTLFPADLPHTVVLPELGVALHGQSYRQQHVLDNLAAGFPAALPGLCNIGLLHTSLDGREGHAPYAPCKLDELRSRGYQYWALGHVHQSEVVCEDPFVVFPGCLQGRHIRESGPKGCYLVTASENTITSLDWYPLDVVRWSLCRVNLGRSATLADVVTEVREALSQTLIQASGRILAVRILLEGNSPIHAELQGKLYWLQHALTEVAAELASEELWIEKVVAATTDLVEHQAILASEGAFGGLLQNIRDLPETLEALPGLSDTLASLRNKLPPEVMTAERGFDLEDPEVLARLISEAKELLLTKLLEPGAGV